MRPILDEIEQEIQQGGDIDEEDLFRRLAGAFYDGFTMQSDAARLAVLVVYTHPEAASILAKKITSGRKTFVDYIQRRQQEGRFDSHIDANFFVQVMATTFAMRAVGCGLYDMLPFAHLSREDAINQLVSLLLYGITRRNVPGTTTST